MEPDKFWRIINGPPDGRKYKKLENHEELSQNMGRMIRVQQVQEDGSSRFLAGGILVFVKQDAGFMQLRSVFRKGCTFSVQLEGGVFWALSP